MRDRPKSTTNRNIISMSDSTNTTVVEPRNSLAVGHETFFHFEFDAFEEFFELG